MLGGEKVWKKKHRRKTTKWKKPTRQFFFDFHSSNDNIRTSHHSFYHSPVLNSHFLVFFAFFCFFNLYLLRTIIGFQSMTLTFINVCGENMSNFWDPSLHWYSYISNGNSIFTYYNNFFFFFYFGMLFYVLWSSMHIWE